MNIGQLFLKSFSVVLFLFALLGCEDTKKTNLTVHWDRDMCSRCVMVVSDRHNTTQVVDPKTGKKYVFDDIGCMANWFKAENISWEDKAKIWITDVRSGEWIDARKAYYDTENVTPMASGFCASKLKTDIQKDKEIIGYDEVVKRILKKME
jgi:copper chaperone NosL